jgi:hypothetical protein
MNQNLKVGIAGVFAGGIGFAVGYKIAEKKLTVRFEKRLEEETTGMREFYQTVKKPYSSPAEAVKELIPPPASTDPRVPGQKVQYNKVTPAATNVIEVVEETILPVPPPVQNVFDPKRDPYIITQDVFMANDPEHEQATLTYYAGSDQLCGEADDPIDNAALVAGLEFKTSFGTDSSDPNVVHIRNEGLHMDFEIVQSEGSYEQEVLGTTPDQSVPPHKRVGR